MLELPLPLLLMMEPELLLLLLLGPELQLLLLQLLLERLRKRLLHGP